MGKLKKIGVLLIILGVFIPSITYLFTDYTHSASLVFGACANMGFLYEARLQDLDIVIVKGKWKNTDQARGHYEGRLAVPYKYSITLGMLSLFAGIVIVTLCWNQIETVDS